jgi:hypothetical protein
MRFDLYLLIFVFGLVFFFFVVVCARASFFYYVIDNSSDHPSLCPLDVCLWQ